MCEIQMESHPRKRDNLPIRKGESELKKLQTLAILLSLLLISVPSVAVGYDGGGTVVGWGHNSYGQASPPTGLTDAVAIAAGGHYSLALKADGTVVGWGDDYYGEASPPTSLTDAVAISAGGGFHSLALKADGTVVGWGVNYCGQVSPPTGLTDAVAIAAGVDHSLALKADGTVVGWGYNYFGQASPPTGLTDVVAISTGDWHSLALKADGTVVGWGYNNLGQASPPTGLTNAVAISAGGYFSLALKADGTVVGWGANYYGVTSPPTDLTDAVATAAGLYHSLALKADGTVVGWGRDDFGQASSPTGLTDVVAIAAGGVHSLALVVQNNPPIADANGPYYGDEGSSISLDGTGSSDPDGDTLTYSWSVDNSSLCSFDDPTSSTPDLTCTNNGGFIVNLEVDDGQDTDSETADLMVYNVAPTVGPINVDSTLVAVGTPINASADFTDPGTNDTHTADWEWGDTTTSAGTVVGLSVGPDSHAYSEAGIYTIQLTVTDDDGDSGQSLFQYVVVYDPSAGFITGGGWFWSEPGAYVPDPNLEGKTNFGFVSKYKKGATIPEGNTEFQFHAGDLNFHFDSYDWLVVTGSNYARLKGVGTIDNGASEYKFMLWAGDGTSVEKADTFRIKIWWEEDEVENVVYDNGMGQEIGGGNIVVHTKKK